MSNYTVYNLFVVLLTVIVMVRFCRDLRDALIMTRIAIIITSLATPWDFFAINYGVWIYPNDPGPLIFQVPVNDLIFIFFTTLLGCTILNHFCFTFEARGEHQSKSENGGNKTPHGNAG